MRADREPKRPIADFMRAVRERPNLGLTVGIGALVAVVAIVFVTMRPDGKAAARHGGAPNATTPSDASRSTAPGSGNGRTNTTVKAKAATTTTTRGATATTVAGPGITIDPSAGGGLTGTLPPTPTTVPPMLPASALHWVASPSSVTVASGGGAQGYLIVQNISAVNGMVQSPGCSTGPMPMSVRMARPTGSCTDIRAVSVHAHRSHKFQWAWHATSTGRGGGTPLAPGNYAFTVGPVRITVTVR